MTEKVKMFADLFKENQEKEHEVIQGISGPTFVDTYFQTVRQLLDAHATELTALREEVERLNNRLSALEPSPYGDKYNNL